MNRNARQSALIRAIAYWSSVGALAVAVGFGQWGWFAAVLAGYSVGVILAWRGAMNWISAHFGAFSIIYFLAGFWLAQAGNLTYAAFGFALACGLIVGSECDG